MKRKISSSDIDTRGRVRRPDSVLNTGRVEGASGPIVDALAGRTLDERVVHRIVPATHPQAVKARFVDGPLSGQVHTVPRNADYIRVGTWLYSFAGKDEQNLPAYCKVPTPRSVRRLVRMVIGARGFDPRVRKAMAREIPAKRTAPPAKGRGARRRAEQRNATA